MLPDRIHAPVAALLLAALAVAAPVSLGASTSLLGAVYLWWLLCAVAVPGGPRGRFTHALSPRLRPVLVALLAFIVLMVLACALASPHPSRWMKVVDETWLKLLLIVAPALTPTRPAAVRRAMRLFLIVAAGVGAFGLWQHFTGLDPFREGNAAIQGDRFLVSGFFGHHLSYGGHVLVAWSLMLAWILVRRPTGWATRIAGWGGGVVLTLAFLWTSARSAQVGAIASLGCLVLTVDRRLRRVALGVLLLVVIGGAVTPSVRDRFVELADPSTEETRLNLWRSSLAGIADRPIRGHGPGNFGPLMAAHEVPGYYESRAHAHNDFLMHAVNGGLPVLAAALCLFGAIGVVLWRARAAAGGDRWIVTGALAALAGILVAGLFQCYLVDDEVEITLFLVLGCALAVAGAAGEETAADPS